MELLSHCKESLIGLSTFSKQLLSLEPHFNGTPVRDKVSTVQQRLHAIEVDAEATIHSAVNHRMKFTEESLAIVGDWLKRTEEDLAQIEKTEKGISIDLKQVSVIISLAYVHVHVQCTCSTYTLCVYNCESQLYMHSVYVSR